MVAQRRDGGLHLPLVRRAPAPEASARSRSARCDSQTRVEHTLGARGADPGDGQGAGRALRRGQARSASTRGRCSTRTSGWPRATASTASSSTCRPRDRVATGARPAAARPPARARAGPRLGRRARRASTICSTRGNGAARQIVVYEANHDLREVMAEIVAARRAPELVAQTAPGGLRGPTIDRRWPGRPTSSSSARSCGSRSARTSPSARTAAPGCASARRRSSATRPATQPARAAACAAPDARPAARRARSPASAAIRRGRPYATLALVVAVAVRLPGRCRSSATPTSRSSVARAATRWRVRHRRRSSTPTPGTQFAALLAIGIFGWRLERRHGPIARARAVRRLRRRRRRARRGGRRRTR